MSQNIFWIWNGWGVLFVVLGTLALLSKLLVPVRLRGSPFMRDVTFWGWAIGLALTILKCGWSSGLIYCPLTIILMFLICIGLGSLRGMRS